MSCLCNLLKLSTIDVVKEERCVVGGWGLGEQKTWHEFSTGAYVKYDVFSESDKLKYVR